MDSEKSSFSTPLAVIIGSMIISFAILISAGKVPFQLANVQGVKSANNANTENSIPEPDTQNESKTEVDIIKSLKSLAVNLNLDQNKFNQCLDSGEKTGLVKADLADGEKAGVRGTPATFINGHLLSGAYPYEILKSVIDFELAGGDWNNPTETVTALVDGNENNGEIGKEKVEVGIGTNPVRGDVKAPITMIEFSDYQCPFCSRFYSQTEKDLKKDYIDTGKVKLYFRDFPLDFHQGAQKAAESARCSGDQGKYWELHDLIFENQTDLF